MKELWFLVSIMSGIYADGSVDVFFSYKQGFGSRIECKTFLRNNNANYIRGIMQHYNYKKNIKKVLCVPEKSALKLLSEHI